MSGKKTTPANAEPNTDGRAALPEDEVKLKPILGIKPGYYLACLYGAVLVLILFFILLYPGIKRPGAVVSVKSEPWGAAVLVDGVYMEAAPCQIFIPKGRRSIELLLPGFLPKQIEIDIGSKLFASAIFPLRAEICEELAAVSPADALTSEAAEFAAWTFAGEPSAAYQIPLSLSEGIYRLGQSASNPAVKKSMEDTISAAARFAVTRASLRDLIRAKTLLDNQGLSPSPLSLLASAEDIIGFLSENPESALWLGDLLPGELASQIRSSSWYSNAAATGVKGSVEVSSGRTIEEFGGIKFRQVLVKKDTGTETFYIAEKAVSTAAWELFVADTPKWKVENIEFLTRAELADSGYMASWDIPGMPPDTAAFISWHAAKAWCEWYSSHIPSMANWEVRLPTESEWEAAEQAMNFSGTNNSGRFWEWCENPYAPLDFISAPPNAISALGSPERSLKGGSWVNQELDSETRASLPPYTCSPFVSFRPLIAPKGAQSNAGTLQ